MRSDILSLLLIIPFAFNSILPRIPQNIPLSIIWYALIIIILFAIELACFFIPGISFSSLMIAILGISIGFIPTLIVSLCAILPAHLVAKRGDMSLIPVSTITLIPMVAFAAFLGTWFIDSFSWGFYGVAIGLLKWSIALGIGSLYSRDIAKRVREIILEPPLNYFIFWKLNFLFGFLM